MIKIKVIKGNGDMSKTGNTYMYRATWIYMVTVFGFIVHTVTVANITSQEAKAIFGKHFKNAVNAERL